MLSIIIPAYNEEKRLPVALGPIISYLKARKISNEIIIVADKSKDKTIEVVRAYSKKYSNIKHIFNPRKKGKGYAIKKGVLASKGSLVLFVDADTSTPITELDGFLPKIKDYDLIIGSREHKDSNVKDKLLSRVVLGNLGNMLLRIFLIKKIKDTQCGFKLFKGDIARKLFSLSKIKGFGFDFEIIFLAQSFRYKIKEMPVNWTYCPGTKVTWQSHFKTLSEMFEIRLNYFMGKYKIR
jgi:dolichyl-phosphate beta-glucosyltransferase